MVFEEPLYQRKFNAPPGRSPKHSALGHDFSLPYASILHSRCRQAQVTQFIYAHLI
jgi:hypothetical protein